MMFKIRNEKFTMLPRSPISCALAALFSISISITAAASVAMASTNLRHKVSDSPVVVEMKSLAFEPKTVNIFVGQKLIWKNTSYTQHSATGDVEKALSGKDSKNEGVFDTGLIDPKAQSKPIVFASPGSFAYHCSVHGKTMGGVVIVKELAQ